MHLTESATKADSSADLIAKWFDKIMLAKQRTMLSRKIEELCVA